MIDYAICVPSKGRPEFETYEKFLSWCPKEKIFLFVEPQDYDNYNKLWENKLNLISLPENNKGISYSRNYIIRFMEAFTRHIIMIDDNIKQLEKRGEFNKEKNYYKLEKLENCEELFKVLYEKTVEHNYAQLGISFSPSNWLSIEKYKNSCRVWAVFCLDLHKLDDINFDVDCGVCEDFEFTIQLLRTDKKVGCYYQYAFDKKMFEGKGGNTELYNNKEKTKNTAEYIIKKHGSNIAELKFNEKRKMYEVSVNWKEIKPDVKHNWW